MPLYDCGDQDCIPCKVAFRMPAPVCCDTCGEDIPANRVEACTHVPPDYMPEDFRKRAAVVLCEACTPDEE